MLPRLPIRFSSDPSPLHIESPVIFHLVTRRNHKPKGCLTEGGACSFSSDSTGTQPAKTDSHQASLKGSARAVTFIPFSFISCLKSALMSSPAVYHGSRLLLGSVGSLILAVSRYISFCVHRLSTRHMMRPLSFTSFLVIIIPE